MANALIELQGRDRALVSSDYLFVQMVDGAVTPTVTGRYDDAMVRSGDRWLIDRRVVLAEGAVAR